MKPCFAHAENNSMPVFRLAVRGAFERNHLAWKSIMALVLATTWLKYQQNLFAFSEDEMVLDSMIDGDSPVHIPGLRTPEREQSHAHWADSPALPAWRPDLQHWLQPVEAWQASEDGLSWCSLREDPGECLEDLEEEIDRFLNGLQAVPFASVSAPSAAAVFASKSGEVCSQEDLRSSDRCFSSPASATALKGELFEEVPDEPMLRCSHCGRSFWAQRLQVHESICKGTRQEARRVFESQQQRLRGLHKAKVSAVSTGETSSPTKPSPKRPTKKVPSAKAKNPLPDRRGFATPVKPKPKASPVRVPSQMPSPCDVPGRTVELDTPPRIQKREAERARVAAPFKELPEVRWQPEESTVDGLEENTCRSTSNPADQDSISVDLSLPRSDIAELRSSRLALVSEAAALCAQVDAMLEGDTGDEAADLFHDDKLHANAAEQNDTSFTKEVSTFEAGWRSQLDPLQLAFPPYDPSKYFDDDIDSSLSWLKKCSNQIQQRRNELEHWQNRDIRT
eukprot:s113_g18.t2